MKLFIGVLNKKQLAEVLLTHVGNGWAKGGTYSKNDCVNVGMDNFRC